eukprot:394917_1
MEQLVESCTDDLWPFGTDKRMLYAIYAHFNTMMKQKSKLLNLPSPVQQRLKTICCDIKSLIQIVTGMTKITKDNLDFELSTIYKEINSSYAQRHRGSYTLNDNESDRDPPSKYPEKFSKPKSPKLSSKKRKKKKKRKRKKSQSVLIYDFEGCSPSEPSVSEPELNPIIIEDYRSDASITSDASTTSICSDATPKNLIPKNYKTRISRHRSLTYQIQHNNKTIVRHRPKPKPPIINICNITNKNNSKSISPTLKSTSAPPPIQFDFSMPNSVIEQPQISSFITSSFASSVSSIMQNNNYISPQSIDKFDINIIGSHSKDNIIENERIFALESQSESDAYVNDSIKIKNLKKKKSPPKAQIKKRTLPPTRRNTAPHVHVVNNNK